MLYLSLKSSNLTGYASMSIMLNKSPQYMICSFDLQIHFFLSFQLNFPVLYFWVSFLFIYREFFFIDNNYPYIGSSLTGVQVVSIVSLITLGLSLSPCFSPSLPPSLNYLRIYKGFSHINWNYFLPG